MVLKLDKQHLGLRLYNVGINHDSRLTLTYITAGSKLVECTFEWETLLQSNPTGETSKQQMRKLMKDFHF